MWCWNPCNVLHLVILEADTGGQSLVERVILRSNFPRPFYMIYWRDGIYGNDVTGRDSKTVVKMEPCTRPVPSTISLTFDSYRPVPPRKYFPVAFCRPVPSRKSPLNVPSRRRNLILPSRPAVAVTLSRQDAVNAMKNHEDVLTLLAEGARRRQFRPVTGDHLL